MGNKDWVASVTSTAKSDADNNEVVMQLCVYNNKSNKTKVAHKVIEHLVLPNINSGASISLAGFLL